MSARHISSFRFWILAFAYAVAASLVLQKLILPMLPALHAGHGLLHGDAIFFHEEAVKLAQLIQSQGWHVWRLFPGDALTGNVSFLAALYALFGPEPALFIPINAAAHALAALMLYLIGKRFWLGNVGGVGGMVAAILFVCFPSALQWYGQNHKDSFSIAGTLLLLYAILRFDPAMTTRYKEWLIGIWIAAAGATLTVLVRPYFLLIVFIALCFSVFVGACLLLRGPWRICLAFSGYGTLVLSIVLAAIMLVPQEQEARTVVGSSASATSDRMEGGPGAGWQWQRTSWLPEAIDTRMARISWVRAGFISYGHEVSAGSQIDSDRAPQNAAELIQYLPRSLVIGLFAPFADNWTQRVTLPRLIGAIETCLFWLVFVGVGGLLCAGGIRRNIAIGAVFAVVLLTVLAYANPNVGTLYRQRYGAWFVWMTLGCVGWAAILQLVAHKLSRNMPALDSNGGMARRRVSDLGLSSGLVIMITTLSYIGFVVRDLLLVKDFGLSGHLDGFFTAVMIPMFFVAALVQPMADAMTPNFVRHESSEDRRAQMVRSLLTFTTASMGLLGAGLFVFAEPAISLIMGKQGNDASNVVPMLRLFILILVCSGWTIIGNAALNALRKTSVVAIGQAVVPLVAVACILVAGSWLGVYAALHGMLLGFAVNLLLIYREASKEKIRLLPARIDFDLIGPVLSRYLRLCCITVLASLAVPVNYYFAGTLDHGGITTWAMGSKMVQVVAGLASISIGAVLLPHFSLLYSRKQEQALDGDVYFSLVVGTWLSVIMALIVHIFSTPLAVAIFHGEHISMEETLEMASILRLGSLQMPFLVATALFVKFSAVIGKTKYPIEASIFGLFINVLLNVLWIDSYGVIGLTAATVVSAALPAGFLLLQMRNGAGLSIGKVAGIIATWAGLLLFTAAVKFSNTGVAVAATFSLLTAGMLQWKALQKASSIADAAI